MIRKMVLAMGLLLFPVSALAEVPHTFGFEAQIFDPESPEGFSYDGAVRVDVYDSDVGGTSLWNETHASVGIERGFLSLSLGSVNTDVPLATLLAQNAGTPLYVQIRLSGLGETLPERVEITSVPYALVCSEAANAGTVQGMEPQEATLASLKSLLGMEEFGDEDFARDLRNAITKECPLGYEREDDTSIPATGYYCKRGSDEMVKVGDFWVDRYENIIVDSAKYENGLCNGTGNTWGLQGANPASDWADIGFPMNGNWTTKAYACSVGGTLPSRFMTWFQAQQACQASGKELITDSQWQGAAAMNTADIQDCNTGASGSDGYNGSDPEATGSMNGPGTTGCISRYGAFDMVGNLWEWTTLWTVAGEKAGGWTGWTDGLEQGPWPSGAGQDYGGDKTWNLAGRAHNGTAYVDGAPAAALRGGHWGNGAQAGVFALYLSHAPSYWSDTFGFRCSRK